MKRLKETDPDIVNSTANRSGTDEERRALQAGLLYLGLTEPDPRRSACTDIVLTARDNLNYALSELTRLVAEAWPKMPQHVRSNLLSILAELIAIRGASVELLMLHLYRRMPTGDLSPSNIWLIETVLDLLMRNREWLESSDRQPFLLPLTVYTFLRLIPDHYNLPNPLNSSSIATKSDTPTSLNDTITALRLRESTFIVDLLRKNFDRCAQLGRDLIRMLHIVARYEPFQRFWSDILNDLPSMSCHHKNIASVLDIITPQYFVQTLIPHEMEQWIRWMLRNVHCVPPFPVRRYQEFFHRKFFLTPESQSLRVCLTRYIVNYFYPDNEMLASSLIPRWNVISWLISQCVCPIANYNIKMALFFDWLFFKPNDCIMNVEPAILAITNNLSARSQPFALSLVDFLTKVATTFHPPLNDRISASIRAGLEDMLRLGVIRSLNPLMDFLLRAFPEVYRSFSALIGPVIDSTILTPTAALPAGAGPNFVNSVQPPVGVTGAAATATAETSLHKLTTSQSVDPESKKGFPATAAAVSATSISSTPSDPRLRRNTTPVLIKPTTTTTSLKNGTPAAVQPPGSKPSPFSEDALARSRLQHPNHLQSPSHFAGPHSPPVGASVVAGVSAPLKPRPPSPPPEGTAFSPPPLLSTASAAAVESGGPDLLPVLATPQPMMANSHDLLSAEDLKELVNSASEGPSVVANDNTVHPALPKPMRLSTSGSEASKRKNLPPPSSLGSLTSPEYRYANSGDSLEQRIGDLRRKFQSYQFRFRYNVDTNVDVRSLILQLDDPIRSALEALALNAKKIGLFEDTADNEGGSAHTSPAAHHDPDDTDLAEMCEAMQNLVLAVLDEECFDDLEIAGRTAAVVCQLCLPLFDPFLQNDQQQQQSGGQTLEKEGSQFSPSFNRRGTQSVFCDTLPSQLPITEERISDSLASPVFVPLRHLCEMSSSDPKRELLLLLLTEMQARQPRVGYHLLYFLTVSKVNDEKMTAYRDFCASQEKPNLLASLHRDMELLADDNRFLFCYLLPTVYSVFAHELTNNTDFIRLIVSKIDPSQANYLVCEILRGHLNFFHRSNITEVLKASLEWTSMEQFFFWQLVNAHELPTRNFLPLISLVNDQKHPEACLHLLLLLQLEKPTNEVVRLLLSRAVPSGLSAADDLLSVTALHYWGCPGRQHSQRFASILGNMINAAVAGLKASTDREMSSDSSREKKRNGVRGVGSSEHLDQLVAILSHLDCMRKKCRNIAKKDAGLCRVLEAAELQSTLQQVIHSPAVPVGLKDRFAELLTLVEDDSDSLAGQQGLTAQGTRTAAVRGAAGPDSLVSSIGSKGGHRLRNLDSRRAAEAERRRTAVVANSKKTRSAATSRPHSDSTEESNSDGEEDEADSDESENDLTVATDDEEEEEEEEDRPRTANSPLNSSSSSGEEDDDAAPPLKRRKELTSASTTGTRKRPASSSSSGARRSGASVKRTTASKETSGSRGRSTPNNRGGTMASAKTSAEDDDDGEDDEEEERLSDEEEEGEEGDTQPSRMTTKSRRQKQVARKSKTRTILITDSDDGGGGTGENGPDEEEDEGMHIIKARRSKSARVVLTPLSMGTDEGEIDDEDDIVVAATTTAASFRSAKHSRKATVRRCIVDD